MTPLQAYEWLAPKLSLQERKALDLIFEAVESQKVNSPSTAGTHSIPS